MQLSREKHRIIKVERFCTHSLYCGFGVILLRKEESQLRQQAKLKKLKWYKDNIDVEKECYAPEELRQLIEKYFQRFKEIEDKSEELKSIKGRHNQDRMSNDYKIKFSVDRDKEEYETSGIEVPNLLKKDSFAYFKNWNGDVRYISMIEMVTLTKKLVKSK
ncbi:translation machinery-associated protein 16 isoform X1 [Parasteatoda tepidariorum]|uniref:translation machinery-associated protein 16 isoform X1 n=1 Tax=Parasteatoda tepidariorum TaxID=114398 RepID=UPI0039BD0A2D